MRHLLILLFPLFTFAQSNHSIYQPLPYSQPVQSKRTSTIYYYQGNTDYNNAMKDRYQSLSNSANEISNKMEESRNKCRSSVISYLKQFEYVKKIPNGWNKAYILSDSYCDISDVYVDTTTNKITSMLVGDKYEKVEYSNIIYNGHVQLMIKNYLGIMEPQEIYFHEQMYK